MDRWNRLISAGFVLFQINRVPYVTAPEVDLLLLIGRNAI